MKTAVVTDSGSNIHYEDIRIPEGLFVVPLQVVDGDTAYREGVEIGIRDTYQLIKNGRTLTTSLPVLGDIEKTFREIRKQGYDRIFSVNITSGLSSTISAMKSTAEQLEIEFDYFDCYTTAMVQLECAFRSLNLFNEGKEVGEVKAILNKMVDYSNTYVLPVDMEHLVRGGRLTPLAAKVAGFLKISPILYLNRETHGKIESFKNVRTMKRALNTVANDMKEHGVDENYRICVTHVLDQPLGEHMLGLLKEVFPQTDIYLTDLISVVGVHTGIGCIALQYVKVRNLDENSNRE